MHLSGEQINKRGPRAAIRYVHEIHPGHILNSSPDTWEGAPMPAEAMLILPGVALA